MKAQNMIRYQKKRKNKNEVKKIKTRQCQKKEGGGIGGEYWVYKGAEKG